MRYLLSLLFPLLFTACDFNESKKISTEKRLSSVACGFEIPAGKNVLCGTIAVPENHANPNGPKIGLSVAIIKSAALTKNDPIIYLEGGPGGSAIDSAHHWIDFDIAEDRDMIIYDQRGTGHSIPFLDCHPEVTTQYGNQSPTYRELGRLCREELLTNGSDTDQYHTQNSAEDLEIIRQQLGIESWIIYGISYGTALAQTYAKSYPEHTSAIVIDSVLPLNHPFFSENIKKVPAAFETLFDACAQESECNNAYPNVKSRFLSLVDTLNSDPETLTYEDLDTETIIGTFQLTGDLFADMLWKAMYSTELATAIPYIIWNEEADSFRISRLLYSAFNGDNDSDSSMSDIMYLSVMCHDFIAIDSRENMQTGFLDLGEYSGTLSYEDESTIYDICDTIVTERAGTGFNTLGTHAVPTLVMAGEFDPVTPPSLSQEVYNALNKAYFFNLDHQGHGVTSEGCGKEIMRQFIDNPEVAPTNHCSVLETNFKVASAHIAERTPAALNSRVKTEIKEKAEELKKYWPIR